MKTNGADGSNVFKPLFDELYRLALCNLFLVVATVAGVKVVVAQGLPVKSQPLSASYAFTDTGSLHEAIVRPLIDDRRFDDAIRLYQHWTANPSKEDRMKLHDQMRLVRLHALKAVWSLDVRGQSYAQMLPQVMRDAKGAISQFESQTLLDDSQIPTRNDHQLFFEFALEQGRVEFARHLIAFHLATSNDDLSNKNASNAIRDALDTLNLLYDRCSDRISQLAQMREVRNSQMWLVELHRLANEILLLRIDVFAMQLDKVDFSADAEKIAASTNLLREIERVSPQLSDQVSFGPRMNLLTARAQSQAGSAIEALQLLEQDQPQITDPELLLANRLLAAEIVGQNGDAESLERSKRELLAVLYSHKRVTPPLAHSVFRFNLRRLIAAPESGKATRKNEKMVLGYESLGKTLIQPPALSGLLALKEAIGREFGDYWRLRAEALLLRSLPREKDSNTELVLSQVQQDLLANRGEEALARLRAAEEAAFAVNDLKTGFDFAKNRIALAYKLVIQRQGDTVNPQSIAAMLEIAKQWSEDCLRYKSLVGAAELHLQAVEFARGLLRNSQLSQGETDRVFKALAQKHLAHFPASQGALTVAEYLAVVASMAGDFAQAASVYAEWHHELDGSGEAANASTKTIARSRHAAFAVLDLAASGDLTRSGNLRLDRKPIYNVARSTYWIDRVDGDEISATDDGAQVPNWLLQLGDAVDRISQSEPGSELSLQSMPDLDPIESVAWQLTVARAISQRLYGFQEVHASWRQELDRSSSQLGVLLEEGASLDHLASGLSEVRQLLTVLSAASNGDAAKAISDWKVVVDKKDSFQNFLWYGRLLALGEPKEATRAHKLFKSILLPKLPPRSPTWWAVLGDYLAALKNAGESDKAEREFQLVLELETEIPESWRESLKKSFDQ